MNRWKVLSCCVLMAAGLLLATMARAGTISIPVPNGDFELPQIPDGNSYLVGIPDYWEDVVGGDPTGTMTGISKNSGLIGSGQAFFQGLIQGTAPVAWLHMIDVGANYVAGDTYTLEFDYANSVIGDPYSVTAKLAYDDGQFLFAQQTFQVEASQGWTHGMVYGIATPEKAGSIGIVFEFNVGTGTYHQPWLDNVTLSRSVVPEPAAIIMLLTGIISLVAYAWRKRR